MNKRPIIIILMIFILGISVYIGDTLISYKKDSELGGFPVPRNAELIKSENNFKSYTWSRASENRGLPSSYQWRLKLNDWEIVEDEGTSTVYKKGNTLINILCQNDYLSVAIESN